MHPDRSDRLTVEAGPFLPAAFRDRLHSAIRDPHAKTEHMLSWEVYSLLRDAWSISPRNRRHVPSDAIDFRPDRFVLEVFAPGYEAFDRVREIFGAVSDGPIRIGPHWYESAHAAAWALAKWVHDVIIAVVFVDDPWTWLTSAERSQLDAEKPWLQDVGLIDAVRLAEREFGSPGQDKPPGWEASEVKELWLDDWHNWHKLPQSAIERSFRAWEKQIARALRRLHIVLRTRLTDDERSRLDALLDREAIKAHWFCHEQGIPDERSNAPAQRVTVDEANRRFLAMLDDGRLDREAVSLRQAAAAIGCSPATIRQTRAWQRIGSDRHRDRRPRVTARQDVVERIAAADEAVGRLQRDEQDGQVPASQARRPGFRPTQAR